MKIDMMESLGYSFLRHVQGCWVVQTNWKWHERGVRERQGQVEEEFKKMRGQFGLDVFKKTKDAEGLLKHAELDALGVTRDGDVHALEAAFHEGGLQYGRTIEDTFRIVRNKMLRTYLVLKDLGFCEAAQHIWFISPKVKGGRAKRLEELFGELERTYPSVQWHLCINRSVETEVLQPTLDKTTDMSDMSELFLRARTLLKVIEPDQAGGAAPATPPPAPER